MRRISDHQPLVKLNTPLGRLVKELANKFKYPYSTKKEGAYVDAIKENVDQFIEIIEKFTERDPFIDQLKSNLAVYRLLSNKLYDTIKEYLRGNANDAYMIIDELIRSEFINRYWGKLRIQIPNECYLFRARESEEPLDTLGDIFHIPFDKIHKVKAQRYSIAGVPCLYLGSSIFVCWLEMDRPDLNQLYLSCFTPSPTSSLNVLDLSSSFELFLPEVEMNDIIEYNNDNENYEYIKAAIVTWPIAQACSFSRKHKNENFYVEYIIPNLLLQWIKKNKDVNGLRYLSTRYNFRHGPKKGYNYVFPPQIFEGKYCSSLSDKFQLTKPTSWQILQALANGGGLSELYEQPTLRPETFEDELISDYINTSFGSVEHVLLKDPTKLRSINNVFP